MLLCDPNIMENTLIRMSLLEPPPASPVPATCKIFGPQLSFKIVAFFDIFRIRPILDYPKSKPAQSFVIFAWEEKVMDGCPNGTFMSLPVTLDGHAEDSIDNNWVVMTFHNPFSDFIEF